MCKSNVGNKLAGVVKCAVACDLDRHILRHELMRLQRDKQRGRNQLRESIVLSKLAPNASCWVYDGSLRSRLQS